MLTRHMNLWIQATRTTNAGEWKTFIRGFFLNRVLQAPTPTPHNYIHQKGLPSVWGSGMLSYCGATWEMRLQEVTALQEGASCNYPPSEI